MGSRPRRRKEQDAYTQSSSADLIATHAAAVLAGFPAVRDLFAAVGNSIDFSAQHEVKDDHASFLRCKLYSSGVMSAARRARRALRFLRGNLIDLSPVTQHRYAAFDSSQLLEPTALAAIRRIEVEVAQVARDSVQAFWDLRTGAFINRPRTPGRGAMLADHWYNDAPYKSRLPRIDWPYLVVARKIVELAKRHDIRVIERANAAAAIEFDSLRKQSRADEDGLPHDIAEPTAVSDFKLRDGHYFILEALLDGRWTTKDRRIGASKIAALADGQGRRCKPSGAFKARLKQLVDHGYLGIDRSSGRDGGYWLTKKGERAVTRH